MPKTDLELTSHSAGKSSCGFLSFLSRNEGETRSGEPAGTLEDFVVAYDGINGWCVFLWSVRSRG